MSIIPSWGSANKALSFHLRLPKTNITSITNAEGDWRKRRPPFTVSGTVNWFNRYRSLCAQF